MAAALVAARVLTIRPKTNIHVVKANLALTTWIFVFGRIVKTREATSATAMIAHSG